MTQEFKSIEEIKEEVAKEHGYPDWETVLSERHNGTIESIMTEIAQRHTQQYIDSNKELYNEQLEEYASFQVLIKSMEDKIKYLQQSNKELVEMYKECFEMFIPQDKWDEATEFLSTYGNGLAKELLNKQS